MSCQSPQPQHRSHQHGRGWARRRKGTLHWALSCLTCWFPLSCDLWFSSSFGKWWHTFTFQQVLRTKMGIKKKEKKRSLALPQLLWVVLCAPFPFLCFRSTQNKAKRNLFLTCNMLSNLFFPQTGYCLWSSMPRSCYSWLTIKIKLIYISFAPGVWYFSNNPMEFEPEDWTSKQQALDTTVYYRAQD